MHYNTILLAIFAAGTVSESVGASPHNNGRSNANNCIPLHLKCIPVDNKSDPLPPNETCCLNDVPGMDVSLAVISIHSYVALQIAIRLFSHLSAMPRQGHVNWHKGKVASLNLGVVCSIFFQVQRYLYNLLSLKIIIDRALAPAPFKHLFCLCNNKKKS